MLVAREAQKLRELGDSRAPYIREKDRPLQAMAESYKAMDAAAADGMKTSADAIADIPTAFGNVKDDSNETSWCVFSHDGKKAYPFVAEGSGGEEFCAAMVQDGPNFAGLRATVDGSPKFLHVLHYFLYIVD